MIFAGRRDEVSRLVDVLKLKNNRNKKLAILGIEGPGGVGKSTIIDHAEESVDYAEQGSLRIFIDGSRDLGSLPDLIRKIVHAAKTDAKSRFSHADAVFPETEKALADFNDIVKFESDKAKDANDQQKQKIAKYVKFALGYGGQALSALDDPRANKIGGILKIIDAQVDVNGLIRFQDEIPGVLDTLGMTRLNERNALRDNAREVFAGTLAKDISALLDGYANEDWWRPRGRKVKNCDSLVFIVDDYEKVELIAGDFFPIHFLPQLKDSPFNSVVIISGRDDVTLTNVAWEQHLNRNFVKPSIDVGPLQYSQVEEIAKSAFVDPKGLWNDTEGYPFYINLWIDAQRKGGDSAVILKKFHERTTRWMTEKQKSWLEYCLFIDNINIDSLKKMIEPNSDALEIFNWFEKEASIRSTTSSSYTVRNFLRKKLIEYMKVKEPSRVELLSNRAIELNLMAAS